MTTPPQNAPLPAEPAPPPSWLRRTWLRVRARLFAGLVVVLPFVVTFWVVYRVYSFLELSVIDPLAEWVLWKVAGLRRGAELSDWFKTYAAPVIAVALALLLLYWLGFLARSRLRQALDAVLLRIPLVSVVYKGVGQVLNALNKEPGQPRPQRVVLIPFPHPGTKVPAFVTGQCKDLATGKTILYVYVPTTPVPTSGYMLLVPEEDVTELPWTSEQALQAIISGGLTAPAEVNFFRPQ